MTKEELCNRYEEIENGEFDNITAQEREITLGLFGTTDDVVNCSQEYKQHHTRLGHFNGGHRLTEEAIKSTLLYKIGQFRDQYLKLVVDYSINPLTMMTSRKR